MNNGIGPTITGLALLVIALAVSGGGVSPDAHAQTFSPIPTTVGDPFTLGEGIEDYDEDTLRILFLAQTIVDDDMAGALQISGKKVENEIIREEGHVKDLISCPNHCR